MLLPETLPGIVVLILLVGAIAGGAFTAYVRLTDKNTKIDTGLVHGRMGILGIVFLTWLMLSGNEFHQSINLAIGLFVSTAILGVALYFIIRRKGLLPKPIIFAHGVLAVLSLAVLLSVF